MNAVALALRLLAVALLVAAFSAPAAAHHPRSAGGAGAGLAFPSISHSEMAVVARHRAEILALASMQPATNEPFRRVLNYANIQFAYCGWGVMPGTVSDEESPFNECAHAYLSAARDVLRRMGEMGLQRQVADLTARVDRDVAAADPVLCRFSDEPFDTASIVRPDWELMLGHAPTLVTLSSAGLLLGGGALLAFAALRRPRVHSDGPATA